MQKKTKLIAFGGGQTDIFFAQNGQKAKKSIRLGLPDAKSGLTPDIFEKE